MVGSLLAGLAIRSESATGCLAHRRAPPTATFRLSGQLWTPHLHPCRPNSAACYRPASHPDTHTHAHTLPTPLGCHPPHPPPRHPPWGQVLRCMDHATGQAVALKVIRNKKRFQKQAQVWMGGWVGGWHAGGACVHLRRAEHRCANERWGGSVLAIAHSAVHVVTLHPPPPRCCR